MAFGTHLCPDARLLRPAAESLKWKHVSRAGVMGCILFYMFAIEHPPAPQEQPKYEYLRVRTKDFPWGEKGLFEYWMTPGDDE